MREQPSCSRTPLNQHGVACPEVEHGMRDGMREVVDLWTHGCSALATAFAIPKVETPSWRAVSARDRPTWVTRWTARAPRTAVIRRRRLPWWSSARPTRASRHRWRMSACTARRRAATSGVALIRRARDSGGPLGRLSRGALGYAGIPALRVRSLHLPGRLYQLPGPDFHLQVSQYPRHADGAK